MLHNLSATIITGIASGVVPNPTPQAPPGSEPILLVLNWVAWGVIIVAVLGFLLSAGKLALAHQRGESSESFKGLAFAIGASILAGGAGGIMAVFV